MIQNRDFIVQKKLYRLPVELIFWVTALFLLATAVPHDHLYEVHFTLCPLANLGIKSCPGCGLGRAITQIFHGNIVESFKLHWFGIPALGIILYRILTLIRVIINNIKK